MSGHRLNQSKAGDWCVLIGRYDEKFIAALKDIVPHTHREWRSVAQLWRVRPEYADAVQDLIEETYGSNDDEAEEG